MAHAKAVFEARRNLINRLVLVLIVGFVPLCAQAGALQFIDQDCIVVNQRPLTDFLDAQTDDSTFFPPLPDNTGWTDGNFEIFALIDYRGAGADFVNGTGTGGRLLECWLSDGRARVSLLLNTHRALGFAQNIADLIANNFDFDGTPTIFGTKPSEVVAGAKPSVGWAKFRLVLTLDQPGDPLPDFAALFSGDISDYTPMRLHFRSKIIGRLPDGTRARMLIDQQGTAAEGHSALTFSKEVIDISPLGR